MNKIYKPNEFGKMIGRTVNTLQRWDREGILKARRTPTNRRYYTEEDYYSIMGIQQENAENQDLGVSLKIESMADFSPDNIAKQVPQLNKLLELREALLALKGPMGNIPAFRNKLQELIADPNARETLEKELAIILEKE